MRNILKTLGRLVRDRSRWEKLMHGTNRSHSPNSGDVAPRLEESGDFGSNPGNLRMFSYVPSNAPRHPALVVVLHGCGQTAAGYDRGAGWSTLADRYGFALLLPEQQRSNNPNGCFNWFLPEDTARDSGEVASIRQMIEAMVGEHDVDRRRVFVTGLSAGGAMTSVMLACYPDVFAAGAIVAGLPYGAAANVKQAFDSMSRSPSRSPEQWGDLVRDASSGGRRPYKGPWPRLSVWHGDADKTVVPANAIEILKQWTDVHGLPTTAGVQTTVSGYPRAVWLDPAGNELIESYTISQMGHGTPLATGQAAGECGMAGPFLLDVGISSSYHIASFFGLAETRRSETMRMKAGSSGSRPRRAARSAAGVQEPNVIDGDIPGVDVRNGSDGPRTERDDRAPPYATDIGDAITRALKAAGLLKGK